MNKRDYIVAGFEGYVWDLCSLRDCLGLTRFRDSAHPVFAALDKVSPRMSEADELFVREVIEEYAAKQAAASMARDEGEAI